jgi:hypothetical protein
VLIAVSTQEHDQDLSLPEIIRKYPGRWVAIIVTQRDDNMQPIGGRVVADDVDRYRLRQKITQYDDICLLYAGNPDYHLLL